MAAGRSLRRHELQSSYAGSRASALGAGWIALNHTTGGVDEYLVLGRGGPSGHRPRRNDDSFMCASTLLASARARGRADLGAMTIASTAVLVAVAGSVDEANGLARGRLFSPQARYASSPRRRPWRSCWSRACRTRCRAGGRKREHAALRRLHWRIVLATRRSHVNRVVLCPRRATSPSAGWPRRQERADPHTHLTTPSATL